MGHRSRLSTLVIDCRVDHLAESTAFWSQALGRAIASADMDGDGNYAELEAGPREPILLLQRVAHPSRIHLDIESDDIEAEARRLSALGAVEVSRPRDGRWIVMQAPSGHRFCVVRPQRGPLLGDDANTWP